MEETKQSESIENVVVEPQSEESKEESIEPVKQEIRRNPDGTFPKGVSGNPNGRPKGKSLKEFWRDKFYAMSDEEKEEFSKKIGLEVIWKMAEGNPQNNMDLTTKGKALNSLKDLPDDELINIATGSEAGVSEERTSEETSS